MKRFDISTFDIHINEDENTIIFIFSDSLKKTGFKDFIININEITSVILSQPRLLSGGILEVILNEKRYINNKNQPVYHCLLVSKGMFLRAEEAINYLRKINNGILVYSDYKPSVGKQICIDSLEDEEKRWFETSFDVNKNSHEKVSKNIEYRKKCRVCGNVFCFTEEDLQKNKRHERNSTLAAIGTIAGAISGPGYSMVENRKLHDREKDKIIDYNRCPNCNSTDLVEIKVGEDVISNGEINGMKGTVSAVEEIKKYKELYDLGIITQEEFDAKKKQLLNL